MDRSLSDSWTGFTKFTFGKEKAPSGYMWFRERRTKIQATARPDYLWLEMWSGMSNAAQKKEKEEWTMEKLKVDNARRLRGIYFIDPEDGEREKKPSKTRGKVGDSYGGGNALQNGNKEVLEEAAVNRKRE